MKPREFIAVIKSTISEFVKDDVGLLAAGLTYYTFLSVFPLILLGINLASLLLDPEEATNFIFTNVAKVAPGSAQFLSEAAAKAFQNRESAGLMALVGLLILV